MTLRDILNDAINLAGVPISDKQFISDYNRAIHDLAMMYDSAKARDTLSITCTDANTEYDLEAGCLKIERVLDSNGGYIKHFTIRGNSKILFGYAGTFTVYETFDQPAITTMAGTAITINTAYLKAIANYIAAKALKKSDPDKAAELMSDYQRDAAFANTNIRKATNPNKTVGVRPFR
jgi:hypothetical protein